MWLLARQMAQRRKWRHPFELKETRVKASEKMPLKKQSVKTHIPSVFAETSTEMEAFNSTVGVGTGTAAAKVVAVVAEEEAEDEAEDEDEGEAVFRTERRSRAATRVSSQRAASASTAWRRGSSLGKERTCKARHEKTRLKGAIIEMAMGDLN